MACMCTLYAPTWPSGYEKLDISVSCHSLHIRILVILCQAKAKRARAQVLQLERLAGGQVRVGLQARAHVKTAQYWMDGDAPADSG